MYHLTLLVFLVHFFHCLFNCFFNCLFVCSFVCLANCSHFVTVVIYYAGVESWSVVKEVTIHTIQLMPNNPDHIFVCTKSSQAYLMTTHGQLIRTYSSGKQEGGDFVCATVSPQGKFVYCVGEDGILYAFDVAGGQLENVLQISDREVIGLTHHPIQSVVATITDDGQLKLWKP